MREGLTKYSSPSVLLENVSQINDDNSVEAETFDISDIFNPIYCEDGTTREPKLILINGAPGMGKTTLCKEIAYRWAKGLLLHSSSLVLLLFLRDPGVQKI